MTDADKPRPMTKTEAEPLLLAGQAFAPELNTIRIAGPQHAERAKVVFQLIWPPAFLSPPAWAGGPPGALAMIPEAFGLLMQLAADGDPRLEHALTLASEHAPLWTSVAAAVGRARANREAANIRPADPS